MSKGTLVKKSLSADRRQNPRISMRPLHKVYLELDDGFVTSPVNISVGGLGFLVHKCPKVFVAKDKLSGKLIIDTDTFPMTAEIVSISDLYACKFVSPTPEMQKKIEEYFKVELAAMKFTKLELKSRTEGGENMVLYNGPNNCELLIRFKGGRISDFTLILFGNYLEADAMGNFVFGEQVATNVAPQNGVSLFQPTDNNNSEFISNALRLMESMDCVTSDEKSFIVLTLKDYQIRHQKNGAKGQPA